MSGDTDAPAAATNVRATTGVRADHVGSLLRPAELRDARVEYEAGRLDRATLTGIENRAILDALAGQRAAGVDVFTDGEFRRGVYMLGLVDAVDGFVPGEGPRMPWRVDSGEVPPQASGFAIGIVTGRLRPRRRVAAHEAAFLRAHAPGHLKVTLPSPGHFARSYQPAVSGAAYPSNGEFLGDVTGILAREAAALATEGVGYVQVDAPTYGAWCDPDLLARIQPPGSNTDAVLDAMIGADNAILDAARSAGAGTAVHVCRGNASGAWLASGGYEPIAERLFNRLRCERLLLEYDTERAGDFAPLRFVPAGKMVVLGLVSTKSGRLESRDGLLQRIDEATRFVPVERLAISPQCGFASNFRGNPLSLDEQWRKLELVASVAREVWG